MAEQIFDIGPGTLVIFRFDTIAKTIAKVIKAKIDKYNYIDLKHSAQ